MIPVIDLLSSCATRAVSAPKAVGLPALLRRRVNQSDDLRLLLIPLLSSTTEISLQIRRLDFIVGPTGVTDVMGAIKYKGGPAQTRECVIVISLAK
jgi:hypothetical protein